MNPLARLTIPFLAAAGLCTVLPLPSQKGLQGQDLLEKVEAMQKRRTEILARVEPAVCSVMSLTSPGGGSGVIFHPRGWILSNFHVTQKNPVMKIGLPNGKLYLADVIGVDPGGDVALLALRGKGPNKDGTWPHVQPGDSDKLKIGGFAYAMGNPFLLASDFKPTVTMGVISGIHRYQKGTGPNQRMLVYPDCVQVDAAVNPGNSGGPLFDENGLYVGINGRITLRDRGRVNTGVGFAISINQIRNFLPDLLSGKHAEHGTMDMNVWTYKNDPNTGIRGRRVSIVQALFEDSVAAHAGVRSGARILSFNGKPVQFSNELARAMTMLPSGFEVELEYQNFNDTTSSYESAKTVRLKLAPMDTGSKKKAKPLVPSFEERPDFKKLRKEVADRKKELEEFKKWWGGLDDKGKRDWRYRYRLLDPGHFKKPGKPKKGKVLKGDPKKLPPLDPKKLPERFKMPRLKLPGLGTPDLGPGKLQEKQPKKAEPESYKQWKGFPFKFKDAEDLFKRFPLPGLVPKKPDLYPMPDVERLENVWRYMDGLMEEIQACYARRVEGPLDDPDLTMQVAVTPYSRGRARKVRARTWKIKGDDYVITEPGKGTLSSQDPAAAISSSVKRSIDLDPLLRPHAVKKAIQDAWLEGGVHIANRVGYILKIRGPGNRAVYLEQGTCLPLGYRYRDFRLGGLVDVRFEEFAKVDGREQPIRARVLLGDELIEMRDYSKAKGVPSWKSVTLASLPEPEGDIEKKLAPVFDSVVKVHGASGLKGIESYMAGIVISKKGHILTWNHVMLQGNQTKVVLSDGSAWDARRVKTWEDYGIAILRIDTVDDDGKPLPLVPIAFPEKPIPIKNGKVVYAVGNGFRIAEYAERLSVMIGVVVGKVRSDLRLNLRKFPYKGECILVDAPNAPGTQGGGLFSIDGELLGVLTPIVESRETNSQLHMAIPAWVLAPIVAYHRGDKVKAKALTTAAKGKRKGPVYTGIRLFETSRRRSPPAYVDRVMPGSPAARAGLRSDDMIVRIDDYPIQSCTDFRRALKQYGPGEKLDVTVKRGSKVLKVSLTLEAKK